MTITAAVKTAAVFLCILIFDVITYSDIPQETYQRQSFRQYSNYLQLLFLLNCDGVQTVNDVNDDESDGANVCDDVQLKFRLQFA